MVRRSFTGKTPANHKQFVDQIIPDAADTEPPAVAFLHQGAPTLVAVRIKDGMDDPKAEVKKMIINATFASATT